MDERQEGSQAQARIEGAWLNLTERITAAPDGGCYCELSSVSARWSGYLGAAYAERRVLFVGANHNGGDTGLLKTPKMAAYNKILADWALRPRTKADDNMLLDRMRHAYVESWSHWGPVWTIFGQIRKNIGIPDDGFAFVNLARCPSPQAGEAWNDIAIKSCQRDFPLAELVDAIDARVIFLAKGGDVSRAVRIPNEIELRDLSNLSDAGSRLVVRYGNGSYGNRYENGKTQHWTQWLPEEAPRIRAFLVQLSLMRAPTSKLIPQ
jgi:hypothetical protein